MDDGRQLIIAYKATFGTPEGQRVLEDLKRKTSIARPGIQPGIPIDTHWLVYGEAQREFVLDIVRHVEADLDAEEQTMAISERIDDD